MNVMTIKDVFMLNIKVAYKCLNRSSPITVQQTLNIEHLSNEYLTRGVEMNLLKRPPDTFGIKSC